jgi:hypothetical protein
MKTLLLFLCLFVTVSGYTQNSGCDIFDITSGEVKITYTMDKPTNQISLCRRFSADFDDRKLIFETHADKCNEMKGVFLRLSNNEMLAYDDYNILCDDTTDGGFTLSGSVTLSEALYEKLLRYTITEFNLGEIHVDTKWEDKEELRMELRCLYNAK